MNVDKQDLVRGSLIGGAAGDALGYPVEFKSYQSIINQFGEPGITAYELKRGVARISDDTQMTLFTANGLLTGITRRHMRGIRVNPHHYVSAAYEDWFKTQTKLYETQNDSHGNPLESRHSWLVGIPQLYVRRAPGMTCLTALEELSNGHTPHNESKGCGGLMRGAAWPLFCACHDNRYPMSQEEIDVAGGEIARLTHKHPLGWMPSMLLAHIIYRLVKQPGSDFVSVVKEALQFLPKLKVMDPISPITWDKTSPIIDVFPNEVAQLTNIVERALHLAQNDKTDVENIYQLGEGWVAEQTIAISIYAVARHIDNFEDTLIAAVNHDGDSDSTGAVAGNIIGAIVGYEAIPEKFKSDLELRDVILTMANDLHQGCIISEHDPIDTPEKQQWFQRYCNMLP